MIRRKKAIIVITLLVIAHLSYAGGILTNTNQSAQYVRMLARNASTDVDAVYYNPAGMTQLSDGWHISISNQTIFQEKKITNDLATLNNDEYIGDVNAILFPNIYAAYKKDKLAFSFGFAPVAGGGSAEYKTGLPSFEMGLSQMPGGITAGGIPTTAYSADILFKGSSAYLGIQLGAAYEINEMISVAVGARYNMATNNYEGHIKDIMINPTFPPYFDGSMTSAPDFFAAIGQAERAAMTADTEVEAEETGSGITPLIGVNLTLNEKLNVAVKYEMNTAIELETSAAKPLPGMFEDGAKRNHDIPAMLNVGLNYAASPELDVALAMNYYFEESALWGTDDENAAEYLDGNSMEIALGLEYDLNEKWILSGGANYAMSGAAGSDYQRDLEHDLGSITGALGLRYKLSDSIDLDIGGLFTQYFEDEIDFGAYKETYNRVTQAVAVGIGYHL